MSKSSGGTGAAVDWRVLVNLGCGSEWHVAWRNFDVRPSSPEIQHVDLRWGIPLADGTCDAVYHSHVLEHLQRSAASRFMIECHRVLGSGGTLRVVTPDLEAIVRSYLAALEAAESNGWSFPYDWAVLEMYDQTVREVSGGEMAAATRKASPEENAVIRACVGALPLRAAVPTNAPLTARASQAVRTRGSRVRDWAARLILSLGYGESGPAALEVGRFRQSGEVHLWMYDRFSLRRLMAETGFVDIRQCSADESRIEEFNEFALDLQNGRVRKPDSIFMEGSRP